VKEPYGYHSANTVTPARGQALIRDGAKRAMAKLGSLQPYRLAAPIALEVGFKLTIDAERAAFVPGLARSDAHNVKGTFKDMTEITKAAAGAHEPRRSMTKYGKSPWVDQFPKSRLPSFPRYRGASTIDAVIIGGGLTGAATAYAFAAAGVKLVLLEAGQIGRGSSGSSSGWLADTPGVSFADLERVVGLRGARQAWRGWRPRGARLRGAPAPARCEVFARDASGSGGAVTPDQVARLSRDQRARRAAARGGRC